MLLLQYFKLIVIFSYWHNHLFFTGQDKYKYFTLSDLDISTFITQYDNIFTSERIMFNLFSYISQLNPEFSHRVTCIILAILVLHVLFSSWRNQWSKFTLLESLDEWNSHTSRRNKLIEIWLKLVRMTYKSFPTIILLGISTLAMRCLNEKILIRLLAAVFKYSINLFINTLSKVNILLEKKILILLSKLLKHKKKKKNDQSFKNEKSNLNFIRMHFSTIKI